MNQNEKSDTPQAPAKAEFWQAASQLARFFPETTATAVEGLGHVRPYPPQAYFGELLGHLEETAENLEAAYGPDAQTRFAYVGLALDSEEDLRTLALPTVISSLTEYAADPDRTTQKARNALFGAVLMLQFFAIRELLRAGDLPVRLDYEGLREMLQQKLGQKGDPCAVSE